MNVNSPIETRLQAVRSRIRRVQRVRAGMVVATVALGGLFAIMAADFLFTPLPSAVRWVLFSAWLFAILAAVRFGCGPLLKPIGLLQVARWLETRHPEMEERLSTSLELNQADSGISAGLLETLARAAEEDVGKVDAEAEIKAARTTRRWGRPALALAVVLALALVAWPGGTARLLARAVMPFSTLGNAAAGRFDVKPGNVELLEGDAIRIEVGYTGSAKSLDLWMQLQDGTKISQPMTRAGNTFVYTLDPVKSGFLYQARAGREESDSFTVKTSPLPQLVDPRLTLTFPEYTGLPPSEIPPEGEIEAVVGTRIALSGRTNTAISAAWLEIAGKRVAEGVVENAASTGRVDFAWTLAAGTSGDAVVTLKHRLGREVEALQFRVQALEDLAPEVTLLSPMQRDIRIKSDDVLPLVYEVTEDFSLAKVGLEADGGGGSPVTLEAAMPERIGDSKIAIFRGKEQVAVGGLRSRFPGSNAIRLRVRAEDRRPRDAGGPGVGFSEWITLRIDDGAESLARQELREQHEGARQTIEEAIRSVREARERMDWHREEVKKDNLNDHARADLKDAGERLAGADEKLKKLASQMKAGVHATKADAVRKAAETVAKAREDLENSPLQDEEDVRDAKLQQARDESESAVKQLENVRNAMDREREKIEDLAQVQDLARQQNELARQAAATTPPADWQDKQRRVTDQLRQQLRERPDARAEALKAQAAQAAALAERAKETARAQENLKELAQQISPQELQSALATEQANIAAEATAQLAAARESRNPMADTLPEATTAADAARDEIKANDTQNAADSANKAAAAMKESAAKSGDSSPAQAAQADAVSDLAGKEAKIAVALGALAKGDAAAALQALQAARAESAQDVAKAIGAMPQVDGNGHMEDAKNAGKQGAEQAGTAAKEGHENQQQAAGDQHGQAAANFEKSAAALSQAAADFTRQSQEAAAMAANPQRAKVSPNAMAEAFQQAAQAGGNSKPASASAEAAAAAAALTEAAQAGLQQMQGGQEPSPAGPPGGPPGQQPDEGPRSTEADPGVPPELAKLGISAGDWEKIQASLKSDIGAGETGGVPEEYRGLVKSYFESISKKAEK